MSAPVRKISSGAGRAMIVKIQVARKQMGLSDEAYRGLLGRVTGKTSSTALSLAELDRVLAEFQRLGWRAKPGKGAGGRAPAESGEARKLRALWLDLHHLGLVRDPSEAALTAFVRRATGGRGRGIEALQWLRGGDARPAIEALKAWAARDAGVVWHGDPRRCVVEAQIGRLRALGVSAEGAAALCARATAKADFERYADADWDRAIAALGAAIRERGSGIGDRGSGIGGE